MEARSRSSGGREMIPRWEEETAGFGGWLGEWTEGDRARGSQCGRWSGGGNREDETATLEIRDLVSVSLIYIGSGLGATRAL